MFKKILLPVDLTDKHGPALDVAMDDADDGEAQGGHALPGILEVCPEGNTRGLFSSSRKPASVAAALPVWEGMAGLRSSPTLLFWFQFARVRLSLRRAVSGGAWEVGFFLFSNV